LQDLASGPFPYGSFHLQTGCEHSFCLRQASGKIVGHIEVGLAPLLGFVLNKIAPERHIRNDAPARLLGQTSITL
jgi:hypothetical protein